MGRKGVGGEGRHRGLTETRPRSRVARPRATWGDGELTRPWPPVDLGGLGWGRGQGRHRDLSLECLGGWRG